MLKFFGKIVCFFKGHIEWDGTAAIQIGHPKFLGGNHISIEYCTRCYTLWGNPRLTIIKQIELVSNQLKKALEGPIVLKGVMPRSFEADFILDEDSDTILRVWVGANESLTDQQIEVECDNGKIVAYSMDYLERISYNADNIEEIREQIGSVLDKIDCPRKIVVSPRIFDAFDFDFGKSNGFKGFSGITGSSGGMWAQHQSPNPSGVYAKGAVCDESQNVKGVSGITGSNKL